ncbi:ABC transporter substrate-binding protein [Rhodobacteraceae bacterium]|nr:ABC transporter substrate-binding protein [Paracoccaceae bacterium]
MKRRFALALGVLGWVSIACPSFAEMPILRAAMQKTGTVNWELDTIKNNGLDTQNGFQLDVLDVAAGPAGQIAFQGGEADVIVSDWLWVARQRAAGNDYIFIPYSKAVGGVVVKKDSPVQTLRDFVGKKIGIAGGPLDKSWLILRAYAQQEYGIDLKAETEQVFGAPPLIFKTALAGETDGAINFWHFMAKMEAAGMRNVMSVADAAQALGLDPETPLLGYVMRGDMLKTHPELVTGLANASRAAKDILASNDAEWDKLRDRMNASTDAQFVALIDGFRAGIPTTTTVDYDAANRLLGVMAELGGKELVGDLKSVPEGMFFQPGL